MIQPSKVASSPGAMETIAGGDLERTGVPSPLPASLLIAGRYELIELVGVGGMGSVYRARDIELDEVVALKVLRRELVDAPGMLDCFRREVKLARRVTHPNVARTFDIGEHQGERFLTMEFIEGESLGKLLEREGALPVSRVVDIALTLCSALETAHVAGVVHRDLKPDNVLVSTTGRLAITDFGVARLASDVVGSKHTRGVPMGTPAYMAPEQVEGGETDERADIYALGAILFELLTGAPVWAGSSPYTVAAARLSEPVPDPRVLVPSLPDDLAAVVLRCLARDRRFRFGGAASLATALLATRALAPAPAALAAVPLGRVLPTASAEPQPNLSLLVFPFWNDGGDDFAHVSLSLLEEITRVLSSARKLSVFPPAKVAALAASTDALALGRTLGATLVLDGSYRRAGGVLFLGARLRERQTGRTLGAFRFERSAADLAEVSGALAEAVCELLALELSVPPPALVLARDPVAFDLLARARHAELQGGAANAARAAALLEQAVREVPSDPRVLSSVAMANARRLLGEDMGEGAAHAVFTSAERARAAAPNAGEPHVAMASYHFALGDAVATAGELNRALRLAPSLPEVAELCGRLLCEVGRPDEGLAFLERALSLDPRLLPAQVDHARASALLGDGGPLERLDASPPTDESGQNFYWFTRVRVSLWRGEATWAAVARPNGGAPFFTLRPLVLALCTLLVTREVPEDLLPLLDTLGRVNGRVRRRPIVVRQLLAEALAFAGRDGDAMDAIEAATSLGLVDLVWLDRCPLLEPYHASPRYRAVRAQVLARCLKVLEAFT